MYKHAAIGGTFDHFHNGHQRILDFAFHIAEKVSIGITDKQLIQDKPFVSNIEPLDTRIDNVQSYIKTKHRLENATILILKDLFGPTLTDNTFDCIVVTKETEPNALLINEKRRKNGLKPLHIETVPFVIGEDNKIIRSRKIRGGSIDRTGKSYLNLFNKTRGLSLPPRLRELLRKPLGIIIEGDELYEKFTAQKVIKWIAKNKPYKVITVGDIISQTLIDNDFIPDLQILDKRTQRKILKTAIKINDKSSYKNPSGSIQRTAVEALHQKLSSLIESDKKEVLMIQGEEDLLAVPAILLAPLGSVVIYGQTGLGAIIVPVTESIKYKVDGIIRQFE